MLVQPNCQFVRFQLLITAAGLLASAVQLTAQDHHLQAGANQENTRQEKNAHEVVVATVGNQQISLAQVENHLKATLGDRKISGEARDLMVAAATRQLVNQLIVVEYLATTEHGLNDDQVNLQIERLTAELGKSETTLRDFLGNRNQTLDDLKQQIRWQFGWASYLQKNLTDANLQKYFDKHQKQFDGTTYRVAHLLLGVDRDEADREARFAANLTQADKIRQQISAGELTWEAAVKQHSTSDSRNQNAGDLGFIERRKPMPESFTKAAFELEVGQISSPVRTDFGVHLIKCTEIRKGDQTLKQVRKQVRAAATRFLFNWIVKEQKPKTRVRYTGAAAYFDPDSGKLVSNK